MSDPEFLEGVLERLRGTAGLDVGELYEHYADRLRQLAEARLAGRLRQLVDGEDVAQSVFRTFFRRYAEGRIWIDSPAQLESLLMRITVLKVAKQLRHHLAGKRDVRRTTAADQDALLEHLIEDDSDPEGVRGLQEEIRSILAALPPEHTEILRLRAEGHSFPEIARLTGLSESTCKRAIRRVREELLSRFGDGTETKSFHG